MAVTKGLRGFEPPPRIIGRDPMEYAKNLQDYLDKVYAQTLGGRPPLHGTHHRLDGQDPLDAPSTLPGTVSGDSLSEQGSDPLFARAGHNHALDDSGVPGAITGTVATQGAGPGVSLSGHTHAVPADMATRAFSFFLSEL